MDFDKLVKERHCVRNFKSNKKPDYKAVIAAIEAATKAPLAGNIVSMRYIIVQDKESIKALTVAAQQPFFKNVDYIIVICSDKKDLIRSYYERGKIYAHQQAGASIENLFLKITELGLATCWVGAFSDETVKRILKIPDNIDVEAMLPIGYELSKKKQGSKPDLDRVVFFDTWNNKFMKPKRVAEGSQT